MAQSSSPDPRCAACPIRNREERRCMNEAGKNPPDCPTVTMAGLAEKTAARYLADDILPMARTATQVERAGYTLQENGPPMPNRPRIVEIVDFCRRMNHTKLGLIFCTGLRHEAAVVNAILETNGFTVASVICKVGNIPKSRLGLDRADQLNPCKEEAMCNPLLQAEAMNEAGVDFNILLGLCVGHDTMVLQAIKAPATILAVKDRLMGHNPLAAIYTYESYYRFLKTPLGD